MLTQEHRAPICHTRRYKQLASCTEGTSLQSSLPTWRLGTYFSHEHPQDKAAKNAQKRDLFIQNIATADPRGNGLSYSNEILMRIWC